MSNAFSTLNQVLRKEDDPCELYGKLLATKLRKYTELEREEIMLDIDNMLLNRRQKAQMIRTNSYVIRPPSSQNSYRSEWLCSPPPHPSHQNRPFSAHPPPSTYVPNQLLPQRVQIISNEVLAPAQIYTSQSSPNPTHPPSQEQLESPIIISIPEVSQHTMTNHHNYMCEGYNSSETDSTPSQNILYRAYRDA